MEYEYLIEEHDFLNFQLYVASKSDRIKKRKLYGHIFLVVLFAIVSYYFLDKGETILGGLFVAYTLAIIIFYPTYFKWRYKKHYTKYNKENFNARFGSIQKFQIYPDHLFLTDQTGESKINISEIEEIIEIREQLLIKMKSGLSMIIPTNRINNLEELKQELKELNVPYTLDLNWKW